MDQGGGAGVTRCSVLLMRSFRLAALEPWRVTVSVRGRWGLDERELSEDAGLLPLEPRRTVGGAGADGCTGAGAVGCTGTGGAVMGEGRGSDAEEVEEEEEEEEEEEDLRDSGARDSGAALEA